MILPPQDFEIIPPRHQYSVGHMLLWSNMILLATTGLRCASRAISVCLSAFHLNVAVPSWHTGRYWFMRLGYYKFNRAKQFADDWVWIIDHSVQIGQEKCLLILGMQLSKMPRGRAITYEDLEPIDLIPICKSNGEIVYTQLEETIKKTGVPREIIADHGPDINAGINKFLAVHPDTCSIYDIKHKTAAVLKKMLGDDKEWLEFVTECATIKKQLQQTELAFLVPPNQRTKARYMNVEELIAWGISILQFLDKINNNNASSTNIIPKLSDETEEKEPSNKLNSYYIGDKTINVEKCQEKLGWINKYRDKLSELNRIMKIVSTVESFIRKNGYSTHSLAQVQIELQNCSLCEQSTKIKHTLLEFIKSESEKAKPDETLLGSSEIIESLFGKQKFLSNEQSKSGFTRLIVSVGAFVATTTKEVVMAAMTTVKTSDITKWVEITIGDTVQSLRNRVLRCGQ